MSVEVSHLIKTYGSQNAVNDISFTASQGEILGFLGPNGAGKSTTMKITTCYLPPSSGTVKVCGHDVNSDSIEVRKQIGYLPEHNPLYLDMYVHEYLAFIGNLHELKGKSLKTRTSEMIDLCGLGLEQNKKIGALSKGYRQRVGLAQALIHDPKVLILDEPTTGLDPNQLAEIRALIKEVSKDKTVIFSTHIMQEVQALCERVVIINRGNIVADDKVENLTRLQQGTSVITVEFKEEVDQNNLLNINGVNTIASVDKNKFELTIESGKDLRADLFHYSKEQNLTLLELHSKSLSLESVFHDLTQYQNA